MSRLQQRLVILLLLVLLGIWVGVNRGRDVSEDGFLSYLKENPEYLPPAFPITLYQTNGPYGVGFVSAIAVGEGDLLYIGTYGGGLFKSEDRGKTWRHSSYGIKDVYIVSLIVAPDQTIYAGTIRAGLYKSMDRGETWFGINEGLGPAEVRSILYLSDDELYVGTERGIFLSNDGGNRWHSIHTGISAVLVQSILKSSDNTLYMGTQGLGILRSPNPLNGWTTIGDDLYFETGVRETVVRVLVRDHENSIYAGTLGSGIFKTQDGGDTWLIANGGLENFSIRAMAASPGGVLFAGTGHGVFESRDGGIHWEGINKGLTAHVVESLTLADDGRLYVGTGMGVFVYVTEKKEWFPLSLSLFDPPVRGLTLDNKGVLYAATDGRGFLRSPDGGKRWLPENKGLMGLSSLSLASSGDGSHYLVTQNGLFGKRSEEAWRSLGEGVLPKVISIAYQDGTVLAGTEAGLYESQDEGNQWKRAQALGDQAIQTIQTGQNGTSLLTDQGVFVKASDREWEELSWPHPAPPVALALGQNGKLAVATENTLYLKVGEGDWQQLGQGFFEKGRIRFLSFNPNFQDILFVGTDQGIVWSNDNGRQWNSAYVPLGPVFSGSVSNLVVHPSGVLFVGTETKGVLVAFDQIQKKGWLKRLFAARS